jgi:hypothetical protein
MLISMPHGTSTIFGAFQAILALLANGTNSRPRRLNYRVMKSSPANSFALNLPGTLLQRNNSSHPPQVGGSKQRAIKGFILVPVRGTSGLDLASRRHRNK